MMIRNHSGTHAAHILPFQAGMRGLKEAGGWGWQLSSSCRTYDDDDDGMNGAFAQCPHATVTFEASTHGLTTPRQIAFKSIQAPATKTLRQQSNHSTVGL